MVSLYRVVYSHMERYIRLPSVVNIPQYLDYI